MFNELKTEVIIWGPVKLKESVEDLENDIDGYLTGIENGLMQIGSPSWRSGATAELSWEFLITVQLTSPNKPQLNILSVKFGKTYQMTSADFKYFCTGVLSSE